MKKFLPKDLLLVLKLLRSKKIKNVDKRILEIILSIIYSKYQL